MPLKCTTRTYVWCCCCRLLEVEWSDNYCLLCCCCRSFMNELFAFEVVLVAGAELKAVRDQLKSAEEATP